MDPFQDTSDRGKRTVRYVSYAIIATYGILTGAFLAAVGVIALFQILTELKRHRALMLEQHRPEPEEPAEPDPLKVD